MRQKLSRLGSGGRMVLPKLSACILEAGQLRNFFLENYAVHPTSKYTELRKEISKLGSKNRNDSPFHCS